jgi:Ca-activated chloride channel family protein
LLDASMGMWEPFQTGTPRIVAVRNAINAFVVTLDVSEGELEIGLRTIGGRSDISMDSGCGDTDTLVPRGPVDPAQWSAALSSIDPRGGRALVSAVEETVEKLSSEEGESRIVVVTSGQDQCQQNIAAALESLAEVDDEIRIRVIGLDIDRKLSNSMLLSTATRNVSDPALLLETLQWAILHPKVPFTRPESLELQLTRDEKPLTGATLHVENPSNGEDIVTPIENGGARVRIIPGLHRARIEAPEFGSVELAGIVHSASGQALEIALSNVPPVTLEVDPERPLAGDEAHIQYWGAPPGDNWVGVAVAGAPVGELMVRHPATEPAGEVTLGLPDTPNELEVQFTRDIGFGIHQLLGRTEFETGRRKISIEGPVRIENRVQFDVTWSGAELTGDHLAIAAKEGERTDFAVCIPTGRGGPVTVTAPVTPGDYSVHYRSRRGRSLDRANLEVFEVLATLEGPAKIGIGEDVSFDWNGPDGSQDYLSIAAAGAEDDQYLSWAPTSAGNPARLAAPKNAGDYELRYVRGEDGEVLARHPLEVVAVEITIDLPSAVEAGTRFEVTWSGTAGEGDFIAVATPRSGTKKHLDWAYTSLGSPVTLAAPFEAGQYVVRYISGASQKVIARKPLKVR